MFTNSLNIKIQSKAVLFVVGYQIYPWVGTPHHKFTWPQFLSCYTVFENMCLESETSNIWADPISSSQTLKRRFYFPVSLAAAETLDYLLARSCEQNWQFLFSSTPLNYWFIPTLVTVLRCDTVGQYTVTKGNRAPVDICWEQCNDLETFAGLLHWDFDVLCHLTVTSPMRLI
jgi:hypothetical protein